MFLRQLARLALNLALMSAPFFISSAAFSIELNPSDIRGVTRKKPVAVLQNRYFLKSFRPEFGLVAGTILNESYTKTYMYGGRAALFFNEWLGVETQYLSTSVGDSADRRALRAMKYRPADPAEGDNVLVSPNPQVNAVHGTWDLSAVLAPFYGKMSLFEKFLLHADVYVTGGYSRVETDQGGKSAGAVAGGVRFYFLDQWSCRVELRDRIYQEMRGQLSDTHQAISLDFGASYFFSSVRGG